ncbi:MAG: thioredoxin [Candidatus Promineifilaceae bacterium]|jgi:thioredoxin
MGIFSLFKKEKKESRDWAIIDVSDAEFKQQVIQRSHKSPVLVDFWAAWCGPCRALGPILEELALDGDSAFILAKLDTEHNRRTAQQYQIHSIPAVKLFRNGQVVDEFVGVRPGALVKRFVNKGIEQAPPAPKISGSSDPDQRLLQARKHLAKGRGFEAYVLLKDFPPGPEQAMASQLLPAAAFLFDESLGDVFSGDQAVDEAYVALAAALRKRSYDAALEQVSAVRKLAGKSTVFDPAAMEQAVKILRDNG